MTNKEKAREIADNFFLDENIELNITAEECNISCKNAALEMAEWKDEQFIQMLSEIFDFFDNNIGLYDGGISNYDSDKKWFIDEFTNRILKK